MRTGPSVELRGNIKNVLNFLPDVFNMVVVGGAAHGITFRESFCSNILGL